MKHADVIVIGAGIIGTACAWRLAQGGKRVTLIDDGGPGATAAGMGHLVCMDDDPAELRLSSWSLELWRALISCLPDACAWRGCGTLWLAETHEEMATACEKQQQMAGANVESEILTAARVASLEPMLRKGLAGGLKVPGDGIIYAPATARWFVEDQRENITHLRDAAVGLSNTRVTLRSGRILQAESIVIACGLGANKLLNERWLRTKKGQLAITDRYEPKVSHQLVELGYGASAHSGGTSVAFNVQPRPTGQLLIGSSREFDNDESSLDLPLLAQMLARATRFLPGLADLNIIRCWSGHRAASEDGNPLIGPHPQRPGVLLALGHEGLGVTTAMATAEMVAAEVKGTRLPVDISAWLPNRFLSREAIA